MKRFIVKPRFFFFLASVAWWALTPLFFYLADMQRGFDATGGEAFIPLIPFIVWTVIKTLKE
jgi:hypothetical protein